MKPDTTQQKPFYKQLLGEISQGEWGFDINANNGYDVFVRNSLKIVATYLKKGVSYMPNAKEAKANAEYTALAVNNLHHLAEALETIVDRINGDSAQGAEFTQADREILTAAKEALNRIS